MTTAFQHAISKIVNQQDVLKDASESQTKKSAIEPLLENLGWDTSLMSQVRLEQETSRGAVDYALYLDEKSRIFLEAKKWSTTLGDRHEHQLRDDCNAAGRNKPKLAVLTNGHQWRLYLPSTKKHPELRQFLAFDILTDKSAKMGDRFIRFLSRERVSPIKSTQDAARKLHREIMSVVVVRRALRTALDELATNRDTLGEVLTALVEKTNPEIHPSEDLVKQFIRSRVMEITVVSPGKLKPTSFTFRANGKKQRIDVSSWSQLKTELCNLMAELQADNFNDTVLEKLGDWFYKSEPNDKSHMRIGETGISVNDRRSEKAVRELSLKLLAAFRYPEDALTVKTNQP